MTDENHSCCKGGINIKKWIIACVIITVVAILCSGCITTKIPAVSKPVPPAVFIDYQKTGGIAGIDERLVIFDNGVALISGSSGSVELALNTSDLERISTILDQAQFPMLQNNYPAPRGGADLMNYTISYHGKTVTLEDTAIPPQVQPVLDEMNRIMKSTGTQKPGNSLVSINS